MEHFISALTSLSDDGLVSEVARLVRDERQTTAQLVAALAEFDTRRLYLPAGCSSMFTYCTVVLHLSEHAAYNRIEAGRAARRYPVILERLATGDLTLTAVRLLAPSLTPENHGELLAQARHKSKRELEEIVARLRPRADMPTRIRKLPALRSDAKIEQAPGRPENEALLRQLLTDAPQLPAVQTVSPAPAPPPILAPIAPERYKMQLTISRETHQKLRRAQELLRHVVPNGDPAAILDRALTLLVDQLEKRKLGRRDTEGGSRRSARPALDNASCRSRGGQPARSRHIPAAVRRAVWIRDAAQCAFVGHAGRCTERGLLEYHHLVPFADGGASTIENLELRCRRHNQYEADRWSGGPGCSSTLFQERPPAWVSSGARVRAKAGAGSGSQRIRLVRLVAQGLY